MSLSETNDDDADADDSRTASSKLISTINEDFYNSIGGSYISDFDSDSDVSSDTPVPFVTPNSAAAAKSLTTIEQQSSTAIAIPEATTKDTTNSSNNPNNTDTSGQQDTLLVSERSNGTKDSISNRDTSYGDDIPLLSERSNANYRDASEGFHSLVVSETTDETWRRMDSFPDDDDEALSISTTPDSPFSHLVEDSSTTNNEPAPPPVASPSSHDADTAKKGGKGSTAGDDEDDQSGSRGTQKSPAGPLSQRTIEVIEIPPLVSAPADSTSDPAAPVPTAPAASDPAVPVPATTDISESSDGAPDERGSNGDRSLQGQDIEDVCETTKAQSQNSDRIEIETNENENENEHKAEEEANANADPVITDNDNDHGEVDYDGSISTTNTLRNNERTGRIPRRWIFDRIDGAVKLSEEEERLPIWSRKPPLFLCLPSPLLGVFPWWLEENACCIAVGKWGFFGGGSDATGKDDSKTTTDGEELQQQGSNTAAANPTANDNKETATNPEKNNDFLRTLVMGHALLLNACGLFATILSGLALARSNPSILEAAPFGKTTVIPALSSSFANSDNDGTGTGDAVTLYLGLLALGIDNQKASVGGTIVVGFHDFCTTPGMEQFLLPEDCNRCTNATIWIVLGFFLATMAYLPTFSIGIGRFCKNYDANCSKVAAGLWSLVSLSGYWMVLSCYYMACLGSLFEGDVLYTSDGAIYEEQTLENNPRQEEQQLLRADFEWKVGAGQILFLIGLTLKIIDFASNCCIATPAITRSRELQWDYEEGLVVLQGESLENGNYPHEESSTVVDRTQGGDGQGSDGNPTEQQNSNA
jgi:hypothetical protein